MNPEAHQSYHKFMHVNFFNHVNIPAENIHILSGSVSLDQAELHCRQYEKSFVLAFISLLHPSWNPPSHLFFRRGSWFLKKT